MDAVTGGVMKRILVLATFLISVTKFAMEGDYLYLVLTAAALAVLFLERSREGENSRSAVRVNQRVTPKRKL
jgi:hypothetical protein